MTPSALTLAAALLFAARWQILIPLAIACAAVVVAIPSAARRGKLSIPTYGGAAVGAVLIGFSLGHLAGVRQVRGTVLGAAISILFFLLIATALGCFLALFFYREPRQS